MVCRRPQAASSHKDLPLETNSLSGSPSPKSLNLSLLPSKNRVSTTLHLDKHLQSPPNLSRRRSRALLVSLSDKPSNSLSSNSSQFSTTVALVLTKSERLRCPQTTLTNRKRLPQRCRLRPLSLLSSSDSHLRRSEKVNLTAESSTKLPPE